jgi:hypothetical protein
MVGVALVAVPATARASGETQPYCGGPFPAGWVIIQYWAPGGPCYYTIENIVGLPGPLSVCQGSPVPDGWKIVYSGYTMAGCSFQGVGYGMELAHV